LNLSGVAISAKIEPGGSLHKVGSEHATAVVALFSQDLPGIHTVVFAKD
jgi:hypothetical protein